MSDKVFIQINDKKVEAKGEVLEQILKNRADFETEQKRIELEQQAKEAAKVSAMAKLQKLGLTDDEIAALIP